MSLFRRDYQRPSQEASNQPSTQNQQNEQQQQQQQNNPQPGADQNNPGQVSSPSPQVGNTPVMDQATLISQAVTAALQAAGIGAQQNQPTQPTVNEDELTDEQRQEIRVNNIVSQRLAAVAPYVEAFDSSVPTMVRNQVVADLTPGQKMVYDKYRHEVDAILDQRFKSNPAVKANPEIHKRAIHMVLGEHSDEIESLSLRHATAADVPHLIVPSQQSTTQSEPELSPQDKQFVQGFQSFAKPTNQWDAKTYHYYKTMPKGFLHEMVAFHREQTKGKSS